MKKKSKPLISTLKSRTKKQKKLSITSSGLIINKLWPFLGASPDGIRICECCKKKLIEVKSMYAKRNLPPQIAAKEYLELVDDEFVLKRETKWNYQIQGLMGISGILHCDLVIYTHKGILIAMLSLTMSCGKKCSRS